jgi:hypothetical protein
MRRNTPIAIRVYYNRALERTTVAPFAKAPNTVVSLELAARSAEGRYSVSSRIVALVILSRHKRNGRGGKGHNN